MKTINILALFAISIIASCWAVGCDKDEPTLPIKKSEHRTPPDLDKTSTLAWETVYCIGLLDHELFIGSKYLGIQNWPCISSPPPIYPAAVFPENSFGSTFDIEMAGLKNPIFVQTDFSIPFFSTIENPSAVNYIRFLKHMFQSEEYKSYSGPKLNLYRFTNLKNLDNLIKIFPENPCFAETLKSIAKDGSR